MAYCWYRCERGIDKNFSFFDRINIALYLCGTNLKVNNLVLPEALHDKELLPRSQRLNNLNKHYKPIDVQKVDASNNLFINSIFHLENLWQQTIEISDGLDIHNWMSSILSQPRMFIRIRKNLNAIVDILKQNEVEFSINGSCISLPNGTPVDTLLNPQDYVVQDASSQETGKYFLPKPHETWWDCCSGAGGKSLLLKDAEPAIELTVSDRRNTILHNLKERFKNYGYKPPTAHIVDVADKEQLQKHLGFKSFDGIICDVPCSGSGTWARTPEQMYFFNPSNLTELNNLQKEIACNAAKHLKQGGKMLYITCSVFKSENEDVVNYILKYKYSLTLTKQLLINGTNKQADSMFIAVLEKRPNVSQNEA